MGFFRDDAELYRFVGGVFQLALDDPGLRKVRGTGLRLRLRYVDPEAGLYLNLRDGELLMGDEIPERVRTDLDLRSPADDAHRLLLGRLNVTASMVRSHLRPGLGSLKAMKLLPLTRLLVEPYRQLLIDAGREDLLLD